MKQSNLCKLRLELEFRYVFLSIMFRFCLSPAGKMFIHPVVICLQVIPLHLPPGDPTPERTLQIDGITEQIEHAKQLVNEIISGEVCLIVVFVYRL